MNAMLWPTPLHIFAVNEKHMVFKCTCDASFGRTRWNNMVCRKRSIEESKYINFFQFSCNVKTLFYWERKGDLYTTYVATISDWFPNNYNKDLKTKGMSWFSLFIGQSKSRQLVTSTKILVASAHFSVALATTESQFRALKKGKCTTWDWGWSNQRISSQSPVTICFYGYLREKRRQRSRVVRALDLKSVCCGFKSRSDRQLMLFSVVPSSTSRLCL